MRYVFVVINRADLPYIHGIYDSMELAEAERNNLILKRNCHEYDLSIEGIRLNRSSFKMGVPV